MLTANFFQKAASGSNMLKHLKTALKKPSKRYKKHLRQDYKKLKHFYLFSSKNEISLKNEKKIKKDITKDSKTQENRVIRYGDNDLVKEVIEKGKINIHNKDIKFSSQNLQDQDLDQELDMVQANLGSVEVMDENAVSLKDIDPRKIPMDKNVSVFPREKEVILYGRRKEFLEERNAEEDSLVDQRVGQEIFEEKSLSEYYEESTYFFDYAPEITDAYNKIANFVKLLPFGIFLLFFADTALEFYKVRKTTFDLEKQEIGQLKSLKNSKKRLFIFSS